MHFQQILFFPFVYYFDTTVQVISCRFRKISLYEKAVKLSFGACCDMWRQQKRRCYFVFCFYWYVILGQWNVFLCLFVCKTLVVSFFFSFQPWRYEITHTHKCKECAGNIIRGCKTSLCTAKFVREHTCSQVCTWHIHYKARNTKQLGVWGVTGDLLIGIGVEVV